MPDEPKPAHPVAVERPADARLRATSRFTAPDGVDAGAHRHLVPASSAARRSRSSDRRAPARRRSSSCSSASTSRRHGRILYNGIASDRVDLDRFRERIGFVTQDTQLFSGTIRENLLFVRPDATDDECLDVLRKAALRQPARARRQGPRHGDRRRRREGLGRREAAAVDRARAAAPSAPARVRRGDVVARLAHRGGDQPDDPRRRRRRRRRSPSSSRTGCRRSCTPIASTCSSAAGSSRSAGTTSCSSTRGSTTRCGASRSASAVWIERRCPERSDA